MSDEPEETEPTDLSQITAGDALYWMVERGACPPWVRKARRNRDLPLSALYAEARFPDILWALRNLPVAVPSQEQFRAGLWEVVCWCREDWFSATLTRFYPLIAEYRDLLLSTILQHPQEMLDLEPFSADLERLRGAARLSTTWIAAAFDPGQGIYGLSKFARCIADRLTYEGDEWAADAWRRKVPTLNSYMLDSDDRYLLLRNPSKQERLLRHGTDYVRHQYTFNCCIGRVPSAVWLPESNARFYNFGSLISSEPTDIDTDNDNDNDNNTDIDTEE